MVIGYWSLGIFVVELPHMVSRTLSQNTPQKIGQNVTLAGWVHNRRDHGKLIFLDMRDHTGLVQVVVNPKVSEAAHRAASELRNEFVVTVKGQVNKRPENLINPNLPTGSVEIEASEINILSKSETPPFELTEDTRTVNEELRLKYRYLDLRTPRMSKNLKTRHQVIHFLRNVLNERGFTEIQTPILTKSTPEGARDYLVPSRIYPGKFFALPQSPQQYKQLLMVAGFDKYFQIAPCFRDEDARADRSPGEFYQLDMEMSFVEQDDVFKMMEPLMIELTKKFSSKKIVNLKDDGRFVKVSWREAMEKYGSDKPDLRFEMPITPITDMVKNCGFAVFAGAVKNGGVVHALKVHGGANFIRNEINYLT